MKKSITINVLVSLLMLFCEANIWCQPVAIDCEGDRYLEEIFPSTKKSTLTYGSMLNNNNNVVDLEIDIFQPENDTLTGRPVVIFAHSAVGARSEMYPLCKEFAKRGYVAASISYRAWDGVVAYNNYVSAIIRQIHNMKGAVRFFRNDYNTDNNFKVDTNFIFIGGYSIGAITSLHTAYWDEGDNEIPVIDSLLNDEGGLEGNTNDFMDVSSRVQGVINLSGGILYKEWIDEEEAAIVSYHGTNDGVVSIGHGLLQNVLYLDGSQEIHAQTTTKDIPNYFHPVEGGGHFNIYEDTYIDEYNSFKESIFQFLKDSILCKSNVVSSIPPNRFEDRIVNIFPNPASEILNVQSKANESLELIIFDNLGRSLKRWSLDSTKPNLDITSFYSGIYFYVIKNEDGYIQSGKLVIMSN